MRTPFRTKSRCKTCLILLCIILVLTLFFVGFDDNDSHIPGAEVKFPQDLPPFSWRYLHNHNDRDSVIEATSLCFDEYGVPFSYYRGVTNFFAMYTPPPGVNIKASADSLDEIYRIENRRLVVAYNQRTIQYVNDRVLFIMGGVWPYHLSHFFINNYLPLLNIMNLYYGTTEWQNLSHDLSWASRDHSFFDNNRAINSIGFVHYIDRTMDGRGGNRIKCYNKTVIGLRSTCSCCGCVNSNYPDRAIVFQQMRKLIFSHYLKRGFPQIAFGLPIKILIINRDASRRMVNVKDIRDHIVNSLNISDCEIVSTDGRSFEKQVDMLSSVTILIASHGNALGNAFWMPDHSLVIETQSFGQKGNLWYPLTYAVGNESHPLYYRTVSCTDVKDPCYSGGGDFKDQDFVVDIKKLSAHILQYLEYHLEMAQLNDTEWAKVPIHGGSYLG
jgi:hypothetical protein